MNKDLPIGTKVFLSPDSRWVDGSSSNPVGVEGVIIGHNELDYGWVDVMWEGSVRNGYPENDSDLLRSNPLADVGNLEEFLMGIVTKCGTLSREGTTAKGIVERLLNSGLIKENK